MRTALEHLEAAIRELRQKVEEQSVNPEIAVEIEQALHSIHGKLDELEVKLSGKFHA